MDYEDRKKLAKKLLVKFLDVYVPPRGMDPAKQATAIEFIADAFARRMPTNGDFEEAANRVFNSVRDTHLSNSWPPQAAFVMAMPNRENVRPKAQETFNPKDRLASLGNRMAAGEPVAEGAVWGSDSKRLLAGGFVSREVMDNYRRGSIAAWEEVYREKAEEMMSAKLGPVVREYFSRGAA